MGVFRINVCYFIWWGRIPIKINIQNLSSIFLKKLKNQGTAIVNSITSFVNGILGKNPKPNKLANTAMKTAQNDKVFFKRVSVYIQAEPKIVIS